MQPDLFTPSESQAADIPQADLCAFRAHLISTGTWQTRAQMAQALGWELRYIREVAEALGSEIVRCQRGYKLTDLLEREEFPAALQACDAFHSQAMKMEAYNLSLRKRIHAKIG